MQISDYLVYKDNQLLVFNKPAAIPTQKDKTEDKSLLELAEIYSKKKLWLTNRIDRPASGVTIFAKNAKAAAHINAQFANRKAKKKYLLATIKGMNDSGVMQNFIKSQPKSNKVKVVDSQRDGFKNAKLQYRKIKSLNTYDIFEVESKSGRHHQIRAQFGFHGFPIKGDVKYGARRSNKDRSIHLHCAEIQITHPISGEEILLTCLPVGDDAIWRELADG